MTDLFKQVQETVIHHEKPGSISEGENRVLLAGEQARLQQNYYTSLISH